MTARATIDRLMISIHALREEGDLWQFRAADQRKTISIHALREEGDVQRGHEARRAEDFYPRPPRGGRRKEIWRGRVLSHISIHALREEGDKARSLPYQ